MGTFKTSDATVSASEAVAVSPNDTTVIRVTRGVYVGTTGNLKVTMAGGGGDVTFNNVPVGVLPIQVTKVFSTGTTASNIVALY